MKSRKSFMILIVFSNYYQLLLKVKVVLATTRLKDAALKVLNSSTMILML